MAESKYLLGTEYDLKAEEEQTRATPVMRANIILRAMYLTMDILYGKKPTLPKFKVIEFLARYPYWAWENGGYGRMSRLYTRSRFTKEEETETPLRHIVMGRDAQDNEEWHLRLIDDIMAQQGVQPGFIGTVLMPPLMGFTYLILTRLIYHLNPAWLFAMNARFESHAEHEYMKLVQAFPEWDEEPLDHPLIDTAGEKRSLADLFRHIGLDERGHMQESMAEYERLTGRSLA